MGERLEEAILREVREETGLEIKPLMIVDIFERIIRDKRDRPEYHYVLLDYLCKVRGGRLQAGDDVSRVAWIRRRDLPDCHLTEGTLPVIEKAFHLRASNR